MTLTIETSKPALSELPDNYVIALNECNAIRLSGEDQRKYLQGQVTCDVNALEPNKLLHGAHCNAKGKVFSCFRLFERNNEFLLFQPKSTIEHSLAELKKFGVFAKVDITTTDELAFYALVGEQAATILKEKFHQVPDNLSPVVQVDNTTLVYLSGNSKRYLIIAAKDQAQGIIAAFNLPIFTNEVWKLLEISEGFPYLANNNDDEFVPQMLNMQAINGISFTKGCYLGQETVARMQYLGKNKKALFALSGRLTSQAGEIIVEKQLGENWRKAGDVTASYVSDTNECYIQAVLANDTDQSINLRIKEQPGASLDILELPYSRTQEST